MKIYKIEDGALIEHKDTYYKLTDDWDHIINRPYLHNFLKEKIADIKPNGDGLPFRDSVKPPIGNQEIWAAGVTYYRSKKARMEESQDAGGADFYDKVYDAERPELFFKAMANRTVGSRSSVYIRRDSTWNVPEPELTLFINSEGSIQGYTIGNDMSSRIIEGENPLYLPQAKVYEKCAGLGPCIYVPKEPIATDTLIEIEILRGTTTIFQGEVAIDQMKRKHTELVEFLFRECEFPFGCFLMTGTGIVPPDDFTLEVGDEVRIAISNIGTLINYIDTK
ncbi:fumarylacetoacetate hydrolase family protein [Fulvivirgaceae bacterium BMA10]|uniref:Fumarylacetoacetate hydrolase family protein n=1 Tax=Splendidivirga corallicola TaxID=3051826 RepID=A0ABT8KNF5_9BACT|nr:fumarylacetoacetate hydrolase family protein [Fulvivirgaceae bacterium BMA10]